MILSVGEILADMIGENNGGNMQFSAYCGGAPFNMAVNAHLAGAKVGFIGRVGNDPIGRFVTEQAAKAKLEMLDIQQDDERNTTIAFVTLTNGERDFAFYRHDTADYHIDAEKIDFGGIKDLTTVHLGSLMLSEDKGRQVAEEIVAKTKQVGALLSFDMNFRMDIYKDFEEAKKSYQPFVMQADILKFSEDELADYTDIADMDAAVHVSVPAIKLLVKNKPHDKVILITDSMRAKGLRDGESELGGQTVYVKDGQARLKDGTLAGSVLKMNVAVKNMVEKVGVPFEEAIDFATANPARNLGIYGEVGSIAVGKRADLTVLDSNYNVLYTFVDGKNVYKA